VTTSIARIIIYPVLIRRQKKATINATNRMGWDELEKVSGNPKRFLSMWCFDCV